MNGRTTFKEFAATEGNPAWETLVARPSALYSRGDDIRSAFARDYTRILHSRAYRRLKHKTQVFFNIDNDHICTRMEHVAHVESVSNTIARKLELNDELTKAIAFGHDLGHAPFGHHGEKILDELSRKHLGLSFWHERNGLRFVDKVELLEDNYKIEKNLDLTYAVRDGIVSHCGELDENGLRPREELIDLEDFCAAGQYQPATWEGCVVKIADKIAYIGRDIEDAASLGFLEETQLEQLRKMARANDEKVLNTTVIMHNMIIDICQNSNPTDGICLSRKYLEQLNEIKRFNYEYIYKNPRFSAFQHYAQLVLTEIFDTLWRYRGGDVWQKIGRDRKYYPTLLSTFSEWLAKYCETDFVPCGELKDRAERCDNIKIYGRLENERIYAQAALDYIAGMTDRFAVKVFEELLTY